MENARLVRVAETGKRLPSMRLGQALPLGRSEMAFAQGTYPPLYDTLAFSPPWGTLRGWWATQGMCAAMHDAKGVQKCDLAAPRCMM